MIDMQKAREDLIGANKPTQDYWEHTARVIKIHMPAALDEIDRLRDALIEERARRICHQPGDPVGHWSQYSDEVVDEARQQLETEGKL